MKKFIAIITVALLCVSCSELTQLLNTVGTTTNSSSGVTNSEITSALKEALNKGVIQSVTTLNKENGFFNDETIKILLPEEAGQILQFIQYIPSGQTLVNDVVLKLNRAAEYAVADAKPIFVAAVKNMTFSDASNILFGADNAATTYLNKTTYSQLYDTFLPSVKTVLDKKLVGSTSTNQAWNTLTVNYNKVANSVVGKSLNMTAINTDLDDYVTTKALDALFTKIAVEEKDIRENVSARTSSLLQKVFGQLDKN
ncbi:MAG: DUF4197 domain-containing protein [Bacteroidales bacterium]|nr:DUF4197 domain-containing protein [Bacteroidales bacterium]